MSQLSPCYSSASSPESSSFIFRQLTFLTVLQSSQNVARPPRQTPGSGDEACRGSSWHRVLADADKKCTMQVNQRLFILKLCLKMIFQGSGWRPGNIWETCERVPNLWEVLEDLHWAGGEQQFYKRWFKYCRDWISFSEELSKIKSEHMICKISVCYFVLFSFQIRAGKYENVEKVNKSFNKRSLGLFIS